MRIIPSMKMLVGEARMLLGEDVPLDRIPNLSNDITPEMVKLFWERTERHISLVQNYARILASAFPELVDLVDAAAHHDASKFSAQEREGYIRTTWSYRQTGKGSQHPAQRAAWTHHQRMEDHHPEYWKDLSQMPDLSLAHAVADWAAMSDELGTSLVDWVQSNALKRWKWSPEQVTRIWQLVQATGRK